MKRKENQGQRRDVNRRSYYQRTLLADNGLLDVLSSKYHVPEPAPLEINENELDLLDYVLSTLTQKEKEIL
ncbi:hypothetical protein ACEQPO_11110 [Bacillus sp. SL00103]